MRAAEFLLLVTRVDGRPVVSGTHDVSVAGACLCELTQTGRVTVDERGRLRVTDASPTEGPLLDQVLRDLAGRQGLTRTFWPVTGTATREQTITELAAVLRGEQPPGRLGEPGGGQG